MNLQKQPSRGVLRKRCSENMQKIHRRTPVTKPRLEDLFEMNCFIYLDSKK